MPQHGDRCLCAHKQVGSQEAVPAAGIRGRCRQQAAKAALAAGIGAGIYASYAEAGEQSVIIEHVYQPNAARHAIYQGRYDHYREIETAMRTPWRKLNQSEEKDRS